MSPLEDLNNKIATLESKQLYLLDMLKLETAYIKKKIAPIERLWQYFEDWAADFGDGKQKWLGIVDAFTSKLSNGVLTQKISGPLKLLLNFAVKTGFLQFALSHASQIKQEGGSIVRSILQAIKLK